MRIDTISPAGLIAQSRAWLIYSLMILLLSLALKPCYSETLIVGLNRFIPPFIMSADDKGHYIGFSIEIITAICEEMKVTCQYKTLQFKDAFTAAIEGKVDLVIGNTMITPERKKLVLFSIPYLRSQSVILTMADNQIKMLNDLAGKKVGIERGTLYEAYLKNKFANNITIVPYANTSDMMFELNEGEIDAVMFSKETGDYWVGNNENLFKVIDKPLTLADGFGIFTNLANTKLMDRVNQSLLAIQRNGRYMDIYNTYFGSMENVPSSLRVDSRDAKKIAS